MKIWVNEEYNKHYGEDIMKTFMITTAAAVLFGSMAFAGDFDANELTTKVVSGNLAFGVTTVFNEDTADVNEFETEATLLNTNVNGFDVLGKTRFSYSDLDQTVTAGVSGEASREVYTLVTAYGEVDVDYTADTGNLGDGEWFVTPELGASYALNDKVSPFAEVRYTYNASEDWEGTGGEFEVGAAYKVTNTLTLTPSLVRTYDVEDEATNFELEAALAF